MINVADLDFKRLVRTRRVNGEKTIELDVLPTSNNIAQFELIVEEATVNVFDDSYIIKKLNEKSIGKTYWKQSTSIHDFFVNLINKQQPLIHNGSITFNNYMNMVFDGTGYTFVVLDQFLARSFENLGNDNRLALLQKGLDRFQAEFELVGTEVRFKKQVGNDTDAQFRYGHNIKTISREVDTTNLATRISGTGADGISATYTSPNAAIFGIIDAPPVNDERFTTQAALLEEMKSRLQDEPVVSITVDFVDLRAAGYPYTVPNEGDRVWLIYEPMDDLLIEVRIMEIKEHFDANMNPIRTEVTLSNYKKSFAGTMFDNVQKQLSEIVNDDGIVKYSVLDEAVRVATKAIQNAQTELQFPDEGGIYAIDKTNPNKMVVYNSAGLGISDDGGNSFTTAITGDGIVADVVTSGTLRAIDIIGTNIMSFNSVTNDVITLENGEITTFSGGKQRFGIYGNGLVAYHWETEQAVATLRASHINNEMYGAGIKADGDYFGIGKGINDEGTSTFALAFYWNRPSGISYDRTRLYGGVGVSDSGHLLLQSTVSGGTAGNRVPHLIIDNRTTDGTAYSSARFYVGRDNRRPSVGDFRSGFEVWQYTGDGNGGLHRFMEMDTNGSGDKFVDFWLDKLFVDGSIDINGGITTRARSHFYGHLNMNGWDIEDLRAIEIERFITRDTDRRSIDLYSGWVNTNNVTYNGVMLTRAGGNGGVFFHGTRGYLMGGTNENFGLIGVGSDSTSAFVQSMTIYNRTYTSTSQMVRVTENGILGMSTSSRRYKIYEKIIDLDYAKRIHEINAVSWIDKRAAEDYCHTLTTGEETEVQRIVRIGGIIAEDTHDAGLGMYVNYDDENRPDGVSSFMWTLLIPISKDHENRLNEYDNRFGTIENRIDKLEKEIDKLKGVA